jgi:glucose-1-phosphate adenylyltransferase
VHSYSTIEDTVVLPDVDIGEGCHVKRAIIDRGTVLEPGTVIGEDPDADRERGFRITASGITLVTPDMLGQHLHFTR